MAGASVETTLELWASSLRDVKARLGPLFRQERVTASAWKFLDGLLGNEPRKTGWMRAEAAGDPGPWRQQAILGRGRCVCQSQRAHHDSGHHAVQLLHQHDKSLLLQQRRGHHSWRRAIHDRGDFTIQGDRRSRHQRGEQCCLGFCVQFELADDSRVCLLETT